MSALHSRPEKETQVRVLWNVSQNAMTAVDLQTADWTRLDWSGLPRPRGIRVAWKHRSFLYRLKIHGLCLWPTAGQRGLVDAVSGYYTRVG